MWCKHVVRRGATTSDHGETCAVRLWAPSEVSRYGSREVANIRPGVGPGCLATPLRVMSRLFGHQRVSPGRPVARLGRAHKTDKDWPWKCGLEMSTVFVASASDASTISLGSGISARPANSGWKSGRSAQTRYQTTSPEYVVASSASATVRIQQRSCRY